MKTLLLALCCGLFSTWACQAQQPVPSPILLVYVQEPNETALVPRIALGLAQPELKIVSFKKCVAITNFSGANKLDGCAVQLTAEDAKFLSDELNSKVFDGTNDLETGLVWFATPENKVLGYMRRDYVKKLLGRDGVLAFFADDDAPIFNYLAATLRPK